MVQTQISLINKEHIGVAFWVCIQRNKFFYLTVWIQRSKKFYNTKQYKDNQQNLIRSCKKTFFLEQNTKILQRKELVKLRSKAGKLFHFIIEFRKLPNVSDDVTIYFLDDQIQKTEKDMCGIFRI